MSKVYANLLGVWTELLEEDSIDGASPSNYIETILKAEDGYERLKNSNEVVEVVRGSTAYHINKSCIQYITKK